MVSKGHWEPPHPPQGLPAPFAECKYTSCTQIRENILDEPIPRGLRLPKPLTPSPIPLPRRRRLQRRLNQRAVLEEFDPLDAQTGPKLGGVKRRDLLPLLAATAGLINPPQFALVAEAGIVTDYRAVLPLQHRLERVPLTFLHDMSANVYDLILDSLQTGKGVKYYLVLTALFSKANRDGELMYLTFPFRSKTKPILNKGWISASLSDAHAEILTSYDEFQMTGTGWTLARCEALDLGMAEYDPLRGGSYIPTPAHISAKKAVINVRNQDNRCFEWSCLAALYPVGHKEHPYRPSTYETHLGELNFTGINMPVKSTDVDKFEAQNPTLAVSLYYWGRG